MRSHIPSCEAEMETEMPERLFHYQCFAEDHFTSLLVSGELKFSRPDSFNDPWDCRLHLETPTDPTARGRVLNWFADTDRKQNPSISEAKRAIRVYGFKSNPPMFNAALVELAEKLNAEICRRYRVYCLTEKPDSALMWGHYACSHTGICLEFDAKSPPFTCKTQLEYRTMYPAYDVVTLGYEPLVTKSHDWSYEAEWRLIAEERAFTQSARTIKTDNDFLKLPSGVLKSVTIGSLANSSSRTRIKDIVRANAPDVLVRQAELAPDRYEIIIRPAFA
jgi:hypothetical protein